MNRARSAVGQQGRDLLAVGAALTTCLTAIGLLVALSPVQGPLLAPPALPTETLGVEWSARVSFPMALQAHALSEWMATVRFALALLILSAAVPALFAALVSGRRQVLELQVHRDVGATRQVLRVRCARPVAVVAVAAATVAALLVMVGIPPLLRAWPGAVGSPGTGSTALGVVLGALLSLVLLVAAFWLAAGLLHPRRGRWAGAPSSGGLWVAQVACSTALLVPGLALALELGRPAVGGADPEGVWVRAEATSAIDTAALLARVRRVPDVEAVGIATPGAWWGLGTDHHVASQCGACWTGGLPTPVLGGRARIIGVAGDALPLLGVRVVQGEPPTWERDVGGAPLAAVSRRFAAMEFEGGKALGRSVAIGRTPAVWHRVEAVVVSSALGPSLGAGAASLDRVYVSLAQHPTRALELVATGATSTQVVRDAVAEALPPGSTLMSTSWADRRAAGRAPLVWLSRVLSGIMVAVVAVSLLTGATAAHLQARSHRYEMGLRRALGATRVRVGAWLLGGLLGRMMGGITLGLWLYLFMHDQVVALLGGAPRLGAAAALAVAVQVGVGLLGAVPTVRRALGDDPLLGVALGSGPAA